MAQRLHPDQLPAGWDGWELWYFGAEPSVEDDNPDIPLPGPCAEEPERAPACS